MTDPDEALIEAIAEVVHEIGCGCPDRFGIYEVKVARAVVAHLGLVEERVGPRTIFTGSGHLVRGPFPRRRLVSRWVEVDHGSE